MFVTTLSGRITKMQITTVQSITRMLEHGNAYCDTVASLFTKKAFYNDFGDNSFCGYNKQNILINTFANQQFLNKIKRLTGLFLAYFNFLIFNRIINKL